MANNSEIRTAATRSAVDAFEKERDNILDQLANLKGQSDRLEWVIRVLLNQVTQIEQEEVKLEQQRKQQEEALRLAREAGNVGVHPSERKNDIAERKQQAKEAASDEPEDVKKKSKKPAQ